MSHKETCPGCHSHTSAVAAAFDLNEPCPVCGLSARAAMEIAAVQQTRADNAIKAQFEELRLRADRAEMKAARMERQLAAIQAVFGDDWQPEDVY